MNRLLVVDDEPSVREMLSKYLRKGGHEVDVAMDGMQAVEMLKNNEYDVVFTDLNMPKMDGLGLLTFLQEQKMPTQAIVITAHDSTHNVVDAIKLGAYDFISKPFDLKKISTILEKCIEKKTLLQENVHLNQENVLLKNELQSRYHFGKLIGKSQPMLSLFALMQKVVNTKTNVLIQGDSGTGKELVARALHYNSTRKEHPFVPLNCGAIPENLIESELFGHVKGAFTGAEKDSKGLFRLAGEGTLFLDEIGELPLQVQVKLLRVLQERQVRPIGGADNYPLEARIIAATNRNLEKDVKAGRFREDLFFRLNVLVLEMPNLRERSEDIPFLANHFLSSFVKEMGSSVEKFSRESLSALSNYHFPGNVRELKNIIERALLLEDSNTITLSSLPLFLQNISSPPFVAQNSDLDLPPEGLESYLEGVEKKILLRALENTQGTQNKAAKLLKLTPRSFRYRLAKLGIQNDNED